MLAPELYRNKKVISSVAALLAVFFVSTIGFAAPKSAASGIFYKTVLDRDLDGDHIRETATIRQHGSYYQVVIHFSTGRPKVRLKTYVSAGDAGLSVEFADLNHDAEADLVLTSATSLSPVAIWVNRGGANFQRVNSTQYSPFGRSTGPRLKRPAAVQAETAVTVLNDPLPQSDIALSFSPITTSHDRVWSLADASPVELSLSGDAPRGPPAIAHN